MLHWNLSPETECNNVTYAHEAKPISNSVVNFTDSRLQIVTNVYITCAFGFLYSDQSHNNKVILINNKDIGIIFPLIPTRLMLEL